MDIIYAGIDGTGTGDKKAYEAEFERSFVRSLWANWPFKHLRYYKRGPTNSGSQTGRRSAKAFRFARDHWKANPKRKIVLAGYSRGGAAAIDVAVMLREENIPVACLILFDPVDRTVRSWEPGEPFRSTLIPKNVDYCFRALRDPATESRVWFGNCGLSLEQPYLLKGRPPPNNRFFCTHGGMGGAPWWKAPAGKPIDESTGWEQVFGAQITGKVTNVTPEQDCEGSDRVWAWMKTQVTGVPDVGLTVASAFDPREGYKATAKAQPQSIGSRIASAVYQGAKHAIDPLGTHRIGGAVVRKAVRG